MRQVHYPLRAPHLLSTLPQRHVRNGRMRQVRNRVLAGQVPHQMRRARTALQPRLRGDQVRLEVQEANDLPQTQVRAAVREARMRDYAQVLRVFSCGQCSRGCSAGWLGSSCWWQRFCGASFVFGGFGYDSSPQDQWRPYVLSLQGIAEGGQLYTLIWYYYKSVACCTRLAWRDPAVTKHAGFPM